MSLARRIAEGELEVTHPAAHLHALRRARQRAVRRELAEGGTPRLVVSNAAFGAFDAAPLLRILRAAIGVYSDAGSFLSALDGQPDFGSIVTPEGALAFHHHGNCLWGVLAQRTATFRIVGATAAQTMHAVAAAERAAETPLQIATVTLGGRAVTTASRMLWGERKMRIICTDTPPPAAATRSLRPVRPETTLVLKPLPAPVLLLGRDLMIAQGS